MLREAGACTGNRIFPNRVAYRSGMGTNPAFSARLERWTVDRRKQAGSRNEWLTENGEPSNIEHTARRDKKSTIRKSKMGVE